MTYKEQLIQTSKYTYELPKTGCMNVPGKIFASAKLMEKIEEDAIKQVANVACLPGIYKYSLAMADLHTGYGFGIGGVAAAVTSAYAIVIGGSGKYPPILKGSGIGRQLSEHYEVCVCSCAAQDNKAGLVIREVRPM